MGEISCTNGNYDMCIGPQASNLTANLPAKSPHGTTKRIYLFVDYTPLSNCRVVRRLLISGLRTKLSYAHLGTIPGIRSQPELPESYSR